MNLSSKYLFALVLGMLVLLVSQTRAQVGQPVVASQPVAVPPPPFNGPLPPTVMAWDSVLKSIDVPEGDKAGHLFFSFTNVSSDNVVISNVHPGCGCTTAQLPSMPWTVPPGTNGTIPVSINLFGKTGTLFKNLTVTTDKGIKTLNFRVNILPTPMPPMTEADRTNNLKLALADRQAVFHGDCANCHMKLGMGKYGKLLYDADCAICHEGEHRATMVPDLHNLKVPTNPEFWKTWIAHGKAFSLMPAFSQTEGGPLSEMQIASLAVYLNFVNPSKPNP
jgi:mono/diheme cytochrome c family protein